MSTTALQGVAGLFRASGSVVRFHVGPKNLSTVQKRIDGITVGDLREGPITFNPPSGFKVVDKGPGIIQFGEVGDLHGSSFSLPLPTKALEKAFGRSLPEPLRANAAFDSPRVLEYLRSKVQIAPPPVKEPASELGLPEPPPLFDSDKDYKQRLAKISVDLVTIFAALKAMGATLNLGEGGSVSRNDPISFMAHFFLSDSVALRISTDLEFDKKGYLSGLATAANASLHFRMEASLVNPLDRNQIGGHEVLMQGLMTLLEPLVAGTGPARLEQVNPPVPLSGPPYEAGLRFHVRKDYPVPAEGLPSLRLNRKGRLMGIPS